MTAFQVFSDSSCDLPLDLVSQLNIKLIPFYVSFDGVNYYKENEEITASEFYKKLSDLSVFSKTSLPPTNDYINAFRPVLESGIDIICICLTEKFSGSYLSAVNAKKVLEKEYKSRKIFVIDSIQATSGQGMVVYEAAKMAIAGIKIEKAAEILEKLKLTAKLYFTIDSLEHLRRGGRLGLVSVFLGSLLNIKPIIMVADGELKPHSKVRGRKKAIADVARLLYEDVKDDISSYDYILTQSDSICDCIDLKELLKREYGIEVSIPIANVGTTIGTHTGVSAVGAAYIKKYTEFLQK